MRRLFLGSTATWMLLLALAVVPALAAPPSPANPAGHELGMVPTKHAWSASNSVLNYHGGPVVHDDRTYTIYWQPRGFYMSPNYATLINGFFSNVAAANRSGYSGSTYFSDTQYTDGFGPVSFGGSSFGGSTFDRSAFPASGCDDGVAKTTVCLTDAQLQTEIDRVISKQHWPRDGKSIYFLMTPKNVGSCDGADCAFATYCAYHWYFQSSGTVLYTNQPYDGTDPAGCSMGIAPNGDADADASINTLSHEHNEAITDPLGTAWWDNKGYENADKCAWTFGTPLGGGPGTYYNEVIGSGHYYLQRNWSNASTSCVQAGM